MDPITERFLRYRTAGDLAALGAVFDATAPRLLQLAMHLCGHAADAEDLLQETFLLAMRKAATFAPDQRLEPWLAGILAGEARNLLRKRQRRTSAPLPEIASADDDPLPAAERRELVARLRGHVERLPREQRQALLLQLEHGLTPAEIAEVLEVAPGTVRARLHRGLQALRALLPAALAAWLARILPARGLAAVRANVLTAAAGVAPAAGAGGVVTMLGGAMTTKGSMAAVAVVLGVALLCWLPSHGSTWPERPTEVTTPATLAEAVEPAAAADDRAPPRVALPTTTTTPAIDVASFDRPPGSLRVRVQRPDGTPATAVGLALEPHNGLDVTLHARTAETGADGVARLDALAPGRWQVTAWSGPSVLADVPSGGEGDVTLTVSPGTDVQVEVIREDGAPAAGAQVWLWPPAFDLTVLEGAVRFGRVVAMTDASGRCQLRGVPVTRGGATPQPGAWVAARQPGWLASPAVRLGESSESTATEATVRLVLADSAASIAGLVRGPDGLPVADACVLLTAGPAERRWRLVDGLPTVTAPHRRTWTDAAGHFAFDGLPPSDYVLDVTSSGRAPAHQRLAIDHAGTHHEVTIDLGLGAGVTGTVRTPSGEPAAAVSVVIGSQRADTAVDGRYRLEAIAPGTQRWFVWSDRWAQRQGELAVAGEGVTRLDVVVEPYRALRGRSTSTSIPPRWRRPCRCSPAAIE